MGVSAAWMLPGYLSGTAVLGLSPEEIADLRRKHVIGERPRSM
jgi:hypothetical protein